MYKKKRKLSIISIILIVATMLSISGCNEDELQTFDRFADSSAKAVKELARSEAVNELIEVGTDAGKEIINSIDGRGTNADNSSLVIANIEYVIDGDTFVADTDKGSLKIRLIGIDTPESVHSDKSRNNEYGKMASDLTKSILVEGMPVYLEYDVSPTDVYNRELCYVWLSEDTSDMNNMLNARLLTLGYAKDKVYKPNVKYAETFAQICDQAKTSNTGLWADEGFRKLWE